MKFPSFSPRGAPHPNRCPADYFGPEISQKSAPKKTIGRISFRILPPVKNYQKFAVNSSDSQLDGLCQLGRHPTGHRMASLDALDL